MIQRRTLLQSGAAVALGAPAFASLAQQSVTLKFHTFMAPQSNVWLNMHKAWMDKVEKDSGGRIKFEGYPAMRAMAWSTLCGLCRATRQAASPASKPSSCRS